MSDSSQPHRLEPTRLLCPWNFLGKNTGVDFLLQEIFPTQGSNPHLLHLLHWQVDSLILAPPGKNFSIICNILTFFHSFHSSNLSVDYYEFSTFTRMSIVCVCVSLSFVSNPLQFCGLWPARLLCLWNSPGKNTGVFCHGFSRGSSQSRDQTQVSHITGRFFTVWAMWKAPNHI